MLLSKLDPETRKAFELEVKTAKKPTFEQLKEFLNQYSAVLSNSLINKGHKASTSTQGVPNSGVKPDYRKTEHAFISQSSSACYFCKQSHAIYFCPEFLKLSPENRNDEAKRLKLCLNCLRPGHVKNNCTFSSCRTCHKKHNTILHKGNISNNSTNTPSGSNNVRPTTHEAHFSQKTANPNKAIEHQPFLDECDQNGESLSAVQMNCCAYASQSKNSLVLLSTAILYVYDRSGNRHPCRALLDSGSQSNFITQELARTLQLPIKDIQIQISGINDKITKVNQGTNAIIQSQYSTTFKERLQFLIIPQITNQIPITQFSVNHLNIDSNIQLADPTFNKPGRIDILLGAGIFHHLLKPNTVKLNNGQPILQETKLGWVLSGMLPLKNKEEHQQIMCGMSLSNQLAEFWELEEIPSQKRVSFEEQYCEDFFKTTTTRDATGRFIVRLPIKDSIKNLGDSETIARKRFQSLENKFDYNPSLKKAYSEFMQEYIDLDHMTHDESINPQYIFPHHAVFKDNKIRVVFDGSAKPHSGLSLNDCLCIGPTIQDDLFNILARFRTHRFVLSADVKKMYRQILVHSDDRQFQNILRRNNRDEPVKVYNLKTVTYGTACAPFLAIRCLHEIAHQNHFQYPHTCDAILRDFYVDDILTGSNSIEDALKLKEELTQLLDLYNFELCKWSSNDNRITPQREINNEYNDVCKKISNDNTIKTLGLFWNSKEDSIEFAFNPPEGITKNVNITKRQILSIVSKIFDPLGLVGPVTIRAKVLMQKLWQMKTGWDESIHPNLANSWMSYVDQLQLISSISTPRFLLCVKASTIELHGFCDASETAYGCCLYLRSRNSQSNTYITNLVCAKSKVAPLKKISVPQLELCGALLLAKLAIKVKAALNVPIDNQFFWCDSKIVLDWLNIQPCYLKAFVANRVSQITEITKISEWYHISGQTNPADLISRGTSVETLKTSRLWWHGPSILENELAESHYQSNEEITNLPETKRLTLSFKASLDTSSLISKYSSFQRLKRVTAFTLRFINNCAKGSKKLSGSLSVDELNKATMTLIKITQQQEFSEDIKCLGNKRPLSRGSPLIKLNPFIDSNNVLRVGGRIQQANLSFAQQHPIIIPTKHKLTELIIRELHVKNCHAGTQTLLSLVRQNYWPLSGIRAVKRVLHQCMNCFRVKPASLNQLMGNLPKERIIMQRPFFKCGVDFAGPMLIKDGITKRVKTVKAYICLFICFVTKAVHIELVKDLSTEAFLNALKRFVSRRGKPSDIFSDNGTNFVGANNELLAIYTFLKNNQNKIIEFPNKDQIVWHFNPAHAPHMGGLWEAAIKSAKTYLSRIIGKALLTYEELYTVLVRIEACMNSRPLTPISHDPQDFNPLTPGHFLIGDSMAALPEQNVLSIKENRFSQYQRLQQLVQQFWKRWSNEYLSNLQVRTKWRFTKTNEVKIGELVLLKEENLPALKWPVGRIIDMHPGQDNLVRVVSVQLPNGAVLKRAIQKICLLPIRDKSE